MLVGAGAFPEAVLGRGEYITFAHHQHRNHPLIALQADADHAAGHASHGPYILLGEANALAGTGKQHDVALAVGDLDFDEFVVFGQVDGPDAGGARPRVGGQRGLLDDAPAGGEKHELVVAVLAHRQHRVDALVLLQRQQVDDRLAAAGVAGLRQLVDLHPVNAAAAGEAQQRVVGIGDEQLVDEILFLDAGRGLALAAALLLPVPVQGLRLGITRVRERHHHVLLLDEVLQAEVQALLDDFGAPLVGILLADLI